MDTLCHARSPHARTGVVVDSDHDDDVMEAIPTALLSSLLTLLSHQHIATEESLHEYFILSLATGVVITFGHMMARGRPHTMALLSSLVTLLSHQHVVIEDTSIVSCRFVVIEGGVRM
jgi:hypothetical protein